MGGGRNAKSIWKIPYMEYRVLENSDNFRISCSGCLFFFYHPRRISPPRLLLRTRVENQLRGNTYQTDLAKATVLSFSFLQHHHRKSEKSNEKKRAFIHRNVR